MRCLVVFTILFHVCVAQQKLQLGPNNVIDAWGASLGAAGLPASNLLDEQAISGDPANGKGGHPQNAYFPGWGPSWYYPRSFAIIDLEAESKISSLWFYHTTGSFVIQVSLGNTPFDWSLTTNVSITGYLSWTNFPVSSVQCRYIRIQMFWAVTSLMEVVVYGSAGPVPPPPAPKPRQTPLMSDFIGTNGFIWQGPEMAAAVGSFRQYVSWGYIEGDGNPAYPGYPNNQNAYQPSIWHGYWNFDTWYSNFTKAGIKVHHCSMQCAPFLHDNNHQYDEWKAVTLDKISDRVATEDPKNYIAHADHAWQTTARYGKVKQADNLLKLAKGQPRVSGLGLLEYIEMWNEQDKWWSGPNAYYSPYECAAMHSADYDGHEKTLGTTVGVKNADPQMKVVMGGISQVSLDYIRAMKLWSDYKRQDKQFPVDVINMHHYSNNGNSSIPGTSGISPEADQLKEKLLVIREWIDRYLPGVEFWLSEFGYDTDTGSSQRSPPIGSTSSFIVQGQWLVRTFLAAAAARVDRAHQYWLADEGVGYGTYVTSGLLDNNDKAKPSWYFVYTMKYWLGNMRFASSQSDTAKSVEIVKFSNSENKSAYVLWCPTSEEKTVTNYQFKLDGNSNSANLVTLADGQIHGNQRTITVNNGVVTVDVSETPLFILPN